MTEPEIKDEKPGVGSSWAVSTVIGLVTLMVVLICGVLGWHHIRSKNVFRITIATGPPGDTYDALGNNLCSMLNRQEFIQKAIPVASNGSAANMELLASGRARLAFVQSDQAVSKGIGLVTPLYEELLHILVAKDKAPHVHSLADLQDLRVSIGAEGSGTRTVVKRVLDHLDITLHNPVQLPIDEIKKGFRSGELHAAFLLTALPSPVVEELCEEDLVRFHSLGDHSREGGLSDALSRVYPAYRKNLIPLRSYGSQPVGEPVSVISVWALLVASSDTEEELVRKTTAALFEHRAEMSTGPAGKRLEAARHIQEAYAPGEWAIPYHPGAVRYYRRDEPPFVVQYAEAISLLLTLLAGSFSASFALRGWLRRIRKNRIDAYYNEVRQLSDDILTASSSDLHAYRDRLTGIRRRAFDELVDEKLDANESFSILQDYLQTELLSIEARLNRSRPNP